MSFMPTCRPRREEPLPTRRPGLPFGASLRHADGKFNPGDDLSDRELWEACDASQQQAIAEQFAELRADDVRDAILDAPGAGASAMAASTARAFGEMLWRAWIVFRDRKAAELHERGSIQFQE